MATFAALGSGIVIKSAFCFVCITMLLLLLVDFAIALWRHQKASIKGSPWCMTLVISTSKGVHTNIY